MGREITLLNRAQIRKPVEKSYDDLLEIAKSRALDPTVFESREVAFWGAQISNNRLDSYYTSMSPEFQKQMVSYLTDGISYQDSHRWMQLGDAQSLYGEVFTDRDITVDEVGEPLTWTQGVFYTLRDMNLNGRNTNELIDAIRAGVTRDVSIGFNVEDCTCSVCGKQMFEYDWDEPENNCYHIPGFRYGDDKQLAWGRVNAGRLNETSSVFDGSNLDTQLNFVVQKAEELMEDRGIVIPDGMIRSLENRYHVRMRIPQKQYGGIDMASRSAAKPVEGSLRLTDEQIETLKNYGYDGELTVDGLGEALLTQYAENERLQEELDTIEGEESTDPDREAELEELRSELETLRENTTDVESVKTELEGVKEELAASQEEVRTMTPFVDMGKKYRTALIQDTLTAGVRAQGNDFKRDQWEKVLEGMDLDAIELMRSTLVKDFEGSVTYVPPIHGHSVEGTEDGEVPGAKSRRKSGYKG